MASMEGRDSFNRLHGSKKGTRKIIEWKIKRAGKQQTGLHSGEVEDLANRQASKQTNFEDSICWAIIAKQKKITLIPNDFNHFCFP